MGDSVAIIHIITTGFFPPLLFSFMPKRILLIEHDKNRSFHFSKTINKNGFSCDAVRDHQAAIDHYSKKLTSGMPYDLILMDMQLPEANTAIATGKIRSIEHDWWKKHNGYVPIIGFTDSAFEKGDGKNMGISTVMAKPVSPSDLLTILTSKAT